MGLLDRLAGRRAYLDANVFIYALEGYPEFVADLTSLFEGLDRGEVRAVTSELSLAETLVKPVADGHLERQAAFNEAIQSSGGLTVVPITRPTLVKAARLRSSHELRLPDAIHVATAILHGCTAFLTNDARLKGPPELKVVRLSDSR